MGPSGQICHRCGYRSSVNGEHNCPHDGLHLVNEEEHQKNPRDLYLGTLLGGRYPVLAIIGSGGMGAVYRSIQPHLEREVAIKVILPSGGGYVEDARQRFLREARAIARLSHPAVVTLHDFGVEPDGTTYMVMECVQGRTLRAFYDEGGFTVRQLVQVCLAVLEALDHAHQLGIVHRDIKPENIMIEGARGSGRTPGVKVLDFGLVKMIEGTSRLTQTGTLNGTPAYMSPEQASGADLDLRSDLYSLATVLYEGLAGTIPFPADNVMRLLMLRLNSEAPPLPRLPHISDDLAALVMRGLSRDPAQRPSTAVAFREALKAAELGPLPDQPLPPVVLAGARRPTGERSAEHRPAAPGAGLGPLPPGSAPAPGSGPGIAWPMVSSAPAIPAAPGQLGVAATPAAAPFPAEAVDDDGAWPTLAVPGLAQPSAVDRAGPLPSLSTPSTQATLGDRAGVAHPPTRNEGTGSADPPGGWTPLAAPLPAAPPWSNSSTAGSELLAPQAPPAGSMAPLGRATTWTGQPRPSGRPVQEPPPPGEEPPTDPGSPAPPAQADRRPSSRTSGARWPLFLGVATGGFVLLLLLGLFLLRVMPTSPDDAATSLSIIPATGTAVSALGAGSAASSAHDETSIAHPTPSPASGVPGNAAPLAESVAAPDELRERTRTGTTLPPRNKPSATRTLPGSPPAPRDASPTGERVSAIAPPAAAPVAPPLASAAAAQPPLGPTPPPTNTLHSIDSEPPGAEVHREGRMLGVTPMVIGAAYLPGDFAVYSLSLPGYRPAQLRLPLNGGLQQQKVRLSRLE